MNLNRAICLLALPALISVNLHGEPAGDPPDTAGTSAAIVSGSEPGSIRWASLFKEAFFFLSVEHGFRVAQDPQTRANLGGKFFQGWSDSVTSLHGWADGDPFFVNYIGHPIQGAVAGDIWLHNDLRYRNAEFGRNRHYWVSRLRAMAFSFAYSEQFEIGPISEATIGHVQASFPQQGFVDHVITPTIGMGWMVAEDALDHYVVRRVENKFGNRVIRDAARSFLNPSRSFANAMALEKPWHRDRESGLMPEMLASDPQPSSWDAEPGVEPWKVPVFEFATNFNQTLLGTGRENLSCSGGGGNAVYNLNEAVAIEGDISGCKMLGLPNNLSGDEMTFMVGPRFSYRGNGRWSPWIHGLFGAEKITQELLLPEVKAAVIAAAPPGTPPYSLHDKYTQSYETTGFATALGGGVDWILNDAVAFRVGSVDYLHSWTNDTRVHSNDIRVTMGFVLRAGQEKR